MYPRLLLVLGLIFSSVGSACSQNAAAVRFGTPNPAAREFRAAWVATVANIDWPSKPGLSTARQQAELTKILDQAQALNLNALVFQVRPSCDAFYISDLEPWSEWLTGRQGLPPKPLWDPLKFAIEGAHARGIELHAWFNPYRARHKSSKTARARNHVTRTAPAEVVTYKGQKWLDPGNPKARARSLAVIFDVVQRYDVDGIHIDDYFYPYPEQKAPFHDSASYTQYQLSGGKLRRDDWRRHSVNLFVEEAYEGIHSRKSWVRFGISPFGIARPGLPKGIAAGIDQYAELYADVQKWMREGWCDYLSPQLYWPDSQTKQSYSTLLDWWVTQNPHKRHIWPGNYTSRLGQKKPWQTQEITKQIRITRATEGATGNVHFSMRALSKDMRGIKSVLSNGPYKTPALPPASSWLDNKAPTPPAVDDVRVTDSGIEVRWDTVADAWLWSVYVRKHGRWRLDQILPATSRGLLITGEEFRKLNITAIAIAAVDRCGNESKATVYALDGQ